MLQRAQLMRWRPVIWHRHFAECTSIGTTITFTN